MFKRKLFLREKIRVHRNIWKVHTEGEKLLRKRKLIDRAPDDAGKMNSRAYYIERVISL